MTIDLFIFHHNQQSNTTSFYHYPSPFHIYIQQCYMQIKDFIYILFILSIHQPAN